MMTLNKVFALSMIALSLAACSSNGSGAPSTNTTADNSATQPSGSSNGSGAPSTNTNADNSATQPSGSSNGSGAPSTNTNADNSATQPSGNVDVPHAANDNPPFTLKNGTPDFSVSVSGLKHEAEANISELARKNHVDNYEVFHSTYQVSTLNQEANGGSLDLSKVPLKQLTRAAHKETMQVRAEVKFLH